MVPNVLISTVQKGFESVVDRSLNQAMQDSESEASLMLEDTGTGDLFVACVEPGNVHPLLGFAELLSRRYAVHQDTTTAILLAVLAGTLGPARYVVSPLGGDLPGSLNVILTGDGNPPGLDAMRCAMAPLIQLVGQQLGLHRVKGREQLHKERIELEKLGAEFGAALAQIQPKQEDTWPDARPAAAASPELRQNAEKVALRLLALALEEKPWLISNGLGPKEIQELSARSFDFSLLNYAPEGHAWRCLLASNAPAQAETLRALHAGWRGVPITLLKETIPSVVISNLWWVGQIDGGARWRALREDSIWDTFLVADAGDLETDIDPDLLVPGEQDEWWIELIKWVFGLRAQANPSGHQLSPDATRLFVKFCNEQRRKNRGVTKDVARLASRRHEQVLKVALLLHIAGDQPNDDEISGAEVETAVAVVAQLGANALRPAATPQPPEVVMEIEVEKMVAKLRIHGRQRKRTLFRRYDFQDYSRLEPALLRGIETNRISTDGEFFTPVD